MHCIENFINSDESNQSHHEFIIQKYQVPNLEEKKCRDRALLTSNLYRENNERSHKLWNIISAERYILHNYILWKVHYGEN